MKFQYTSTFKILLAGSLFLMTEVACERNVDQENTNDDGADLEEIIDLEEHEEASDYTWEALIRAQPWMESMRMETIQREAIMPALQFREP